MYAHLTGMVLPVWTICFINPLSPLLPFLTSGHSGAQPWASECPDVKNYKWRLTTGTGCFTAVLIWQQWASICVKRLNWLNWLKDDNNVFISPSTYRDSEGNFWHRTINITNTDPDDQVHSPSSGGSVEHRQLTGLVKLAVFHFRQMHATIQLLSKRTA